MDAIKLLAMTVLLTVLIWVSADSLVTERVQIGVSFEVVPASGDPDMRVDAPGGTGPFKVLIAGPRKAIAQAQALTRSPVRLELADKPDGKWSIPLKEALERQWNDVAGLVVLSVQPVANLEVNVDHMVTIESVPIVPHTLTLEYDVRPQFQPETATIRLRGELYRTLERDGVALQVGVDIERVLRQQPTGSSVTVPVTLDASQFDIDATITPGTIQVTATRRARRKEVALKVPILTAVSFANLGRGVQAMADDGTPIGIVTREISLIGPVDQIERLEREETRVFGLIRLKESDFENLDVPREFTPEFQLPPGVELSKEVDRVEFKLVARPPVGP